MRAAQYWRLENLKSFDEFMKRRFPESTRKAYYLMSIHELLPRARLEVKHVGWIKGLERTKVRRRDRQDFDCTPGCIEPVKCRRRISGGRLRRN